MYENQQKILKFKRLEHNLSILELGPSYVEFESGQQYLGHAPLTIAYPIIIKLDLSMDELGEIFS